MDIIKEIKLQLGKKEVSLTLDQAKKLKDALDEMFGKEIIYEYHDYWRWRPIWHETPYTPNWWTTTGGTSATYTNNSLTLSVA